MVRKLVTSSAFLDSLNLSPLLFSSSVVTPRVPLLTLHIIMCPPSLFSAAGMVTRVGFDHIGLTVHGVFNASIPSDRLPPEYSRDTENDRFYVESVNGTDDAESAAASEATGISVGDELTFVVTG
jgi:RPA43 OB domain in RNA Pol I